MIKLLMLAIVAGLVFESKQHSYGGYSSFVSDLTSAAGHDHYDEQHQVIERPHTPSLPPSLVGTCYYPLDTKCWTEWFNIDDPCGDGDSELITTLLTDFPGKMCSDPADIQAETLSGVPAVETGDTIALMDTTTGLVCSNDDQASGNCQDYRVRFSCYAPFCAPKVCWTDWFDRDNPTATGDWETLAELQREKPGKICDKPLFIEVVKAGTTDQASTTGDTLYVYNSDEGFACRNEDQSDNTCEDYQVRFGCPCKYVTTHL